MSDSEMRERSPRAFGQRHWSLVIELVGLCYTPHMLLVSKVYIPDGHLQWVGIEAGRSRQTSFPFTRHLSTEYIIKYAKKLWDEVCQPMRNGASMKLNNVRVLQTRRKAK